MIAFQRLRIGELNVFASYKGDGWVNLEDFEDMHVTLHSILYSNKVCTLLRMGLRLRKQIILDLLGQVGRNFEHIGSFLAQKFKFDFGGKANCAADTDGVDGHLIEAVQNSAMNVDGIIGEGNAEDDNDQEDDTARPR